MASGHALEVELTGSTRCGESRKEGEGSQVKTETTTRHPPGGPRARMGLLCTPHLCNCAFIQALGS